jgi:hypothetical protein
MASGGVLIASRFHIRNSIWSVRAQQWCCYNREGCESGSVPGSTHMGNPGLEWVLVLKSKLLSVAAAYLAAFCDSFFEPCGQNIERRKLTQCLA